MGIRLVISLIGVVLSLETAPWAPAAPPPLGSVDVRAQTGPSFIRGWSAHLELERARQNAVAEAVALARDAVVSADGYQARPRDRVAFEAAVVHARQGHLERALAELETVLEVPHPPQLTAELHLAAAHAAIKLERWQSVEAHLADLAPEAAGVLAPYAALWRAVARFELGDYTGARADAAAAADALPRAPLVHEARFVAARARLHLPGEEREAVAAIEALLERYPEYPLVDRVTIEIARAEARGGRETAAARRLESFLWDRPFSGRADEAAELLDTLVEQGATRTSRSWQARAEHGRSLRLRRHWDLAERELLGALEDAVAARARTAEANEIRFQLALNAYDSARFETALERMLELEANGASGVSGYNRATWHARSLSRLDREEEAYEVLAAYYAQRSASERHHRLYEFAFDLGMWDRALEHLDALYSRERDWRSWNGAFTHYLAGNHERAADLFDALADRSSGHTQRRYRYWRARSLEHLGRIEDAIAIYRSVHEDAPYRYYGLQSMNRVYEWEAVRPEGSGEGEWDLPQAPEPHPGRVHWYGFGGVPSAVWSVLDVVDVDAFFDGYPPELQPNGAVSELAETWGDAFPNLARIDALHRVGAVEEARKEFRDPLIEFRALDALAARGRRVSGNRPIRLSHQRWAHFIDNRAQERGWWGIALDTDRYPVPSRSSARAEFAARQRRIIGERDVLRPMFRAAARELGDFYFGRRFALDDDLPPLASEPLDPRWHEAYPRAYGTELRESIERYDLNPFYVWALMIVESDMNPDTVSRADAYGLLQVIPKTGDLVATGFGEVDFGIHDLLEPAGSLRYGTWYLHQLLYKFHGQEMLAAVAYNAGPHQVARWLQWRGDGMAMDEFIETVPYDGARRYPQRILQYTSILRAVNELDRQVYIGNGLDPTFEDNIYY